MNLQRDNYSRYLRLGYEDEHTLLAANNYALSLISLRRFEEAKSLMRKTIPVAQRVLGKSHVNTLRMRLNYAMALYKDDGAMLDDLREAVTTLEETASTFRRILGGAHPNVEGIETSLCNSRWMLIEREIVLRGCANGFDV